jgi:iron complex transport system permease protein
VTTAAEPVAAATPVRLRPRWLAAGGVAVVAAVLLGITVGPAGIRAWPAIETLLGHLPLLHVHSGLSVQQATIVTDLRLPRVIVGLLVGALLAMAGASYQGVFRNPLADPYLLGAAAGAGLAVTVVIVATATGLGGNDPVVPLAAFVGALGAVALTYALGRSSGGRSPATLLLAGVAIASFLTAIQTYLQQRHVATIREVYSWILGRLTTAGWDQVLLILPYFALTSVVLLAHRRVLDVLAVGEPEAETLGIPVARTRAVIVATASLATAAAVAVSGLIGFVGIIVPHAIRLVTGASYRVILPLSILFGGAFLALADVAARTATAPAEIPIGVVTAFVGAPFFVVVLRSTIERR